MINALIHMFGFTVAEGYEIEQFADEHNLTLDQVIEVLNINHWG